MKKISVHITLGNSYMSDRDLEIIKLAMVDAGIESLRLRQGYLSSIETTVGLVRKKR